MKKCLVWILVVVVLCGCGTAPAVETISDEWIEPVLAQPREIILHLPGEATVFAMESDSGRQYIGDGYEVMVQTMPAGDLSGTIRCLTGFEKDELTVMQTRNDDIKRYEFVWASEGEHGERLGKGAVLDDGDYHYCLSVLQDVETMADCQIIWSEVFHYFDLA